MFCYRNINVLGCTSLKNEIFAKIEKLANLVVTRKIQAQKQAIEGRIFATTCDSPK